MTKTKTNESKSTTRTYHLTDGATRTVTTHDDGWVFVVERETDGTTSSHEYLPESFACN